MKRRDFLKKTSALSALALLQINANAQKAPDKWDEEWDIVVVGSGFAGSAASAQAIEKNKKVLMIDKMPVLGGNSAINGGAFSIVGSDQQKARKIDDNYELYVADIYKAGKGLNNKNLVEIIAKNGYDAYKFTTDRGVIYRDNLGHFGGHSVPRTIWPTINSGAKITLPLQSYATKKGLQIRTKTVLDDLIIQRGEVVGIMVRENYEFEFDPKKDESENKSGVTKYYKVNGGVIMASGGFSYDLKFRKQVDAKLRDDMDCTNHYGATAKALKMMMSHNVATKDVGLIQLGPWGSPDEVGFGIAPVFAIPAFAYGIMVDAKSGKRFINELADRRIRSNAMLKINKNEDGTFNHPIVLCDSVGATGTRKANVYRGIHKKVIHKFDTLKELADFYKVPYEGLKKSVDDYNRYVKNGKDEEWQKPLFKLRGKFVPDISKPPFYAFRATPKVHHTMGGVAINENAEVLNEGGDTIKGLFAAGEAVGGIHGASRLGSCAVPDCLVFGRIAAKSALARLGGKS